MKLRRSPRLVANTATITTTPQQPLAPPMQRRTSPRLQPQQQTTSKSPLSGRKRRRSSRPAAAADAAAKKETSAKLKRATNTTQTCKQTPSHRQQRQHHHAASPSPVPSSSSSSSSAPTPTMGSPSPAGHPENAMRGNGTTANNNNNGKNTNGQAVPQHHHHHHQQTLSVQQPNRSRLFAPYRAIGLVTSAHAIPHVKRLGNQYFVTCAVGAGAWQVFNTESLRPVAIAPPRSRGRILALAAMRDITFTSSVQGEITVWKRIDVVRSVSTTVGPCHILIVLGDLLLAAGKTHLCIWDIPPLAALAKSEAKIKEQRKALTNCIVDNRIQPRAVIKFACAAGVTITALVHPDTYLNKVMVAFSSGGIELWNIRSQQRVYVFKADTWPHCSMDDTLSSSVVVSGEGRGERGVNGLANSGCSILSLEMSPVIDVLAAGSQNGAIMIFNARFDRVITTLRHAHDEGAVTVLSFRKDGVQMLASGSGSGTIVIWDLEKQAVHHMIPNAHEAGPVRLLYWLADEPVLVSAGCDNAVKMWIFDLPDGTSRLLRERSGHSAPPTRVQFYGDGRFLLSCGLDHSLRFSNITRDTNAGELSQGSLRKRASRYHVSVQSLRLPRITEFACSSRREREWANVISCHEGCAGAYSWSTQNRSLTKHPLMNSERTPSPVQCCAITSCGNYAIVGLADGRVEKFNMQSGSFRSGFGGKRAGGAGGSGHGKSSAHDGVCVTGVAVDALNRFVVSGDVNGRLRWWTFESHKFVHEIALNSPIQRMLLHAVSQLLAVVTDDLSLLLIDINTRLVVRRFVDHDASVTDVTFSPDGRWVITGCMDSSIRVFDIPHGRLIDWFCVDRIPSGVSMSPNGDFIATTHAGSVGLFLWVNRAYFTNILEGISVPAEPVVVNFESASSLHDSALLADSDGDYTAKVDTSAASVDVYNASEFPLGPEPLLMTAHGGQEAVPMDDGEDVEAGVQRNLVTLSALVKSKWHNLPHLQVIRDRNRPVEAPKAPENAPFFLGSMSAFGGRDDGFAESWEIEERPGLDEQLHGDGKRGEDGELAAGGSHVIESRGQRFVAPLVSKMQRAVHDHRNIKKSNGQKRASLDGVVQYLRSLTPSALDSDIRSLASEGDPTLDEEEISLFLQFMTLVIPQGKNFEFLQALLQLFLQVHGDVILQSRRLVTLAKVLRDAQSDLWVGVERLIQSNLCMIAHFTQRPN